jgi:hypothetical protein
LQVNTVILVGIFLEALGTGVLLVTLIPTALSRKKGALLTGGGEPVFGLAPVLREQRKTARWALLGTVLVLVSFVVTLIGLAQS